MEIKTGPPASTGGLIFSIDGRTSPRWAPVGTFRIHNTSDALNANPHNDGIRNLVEYAIAGQDPTDLGASDAWAEVTGGSYVNDAATISYTLTPGTPAKNFPRLQVISN